MSLIKDGKVYRTEEEQLIHLTEKHLAQEEMIRNILTKTQELSVASNLGGYNIVRNSFSSSNSFHITGAELPVPSAAGSFVVLNTYNANDIPAYGIIKEDGQTINIIFGGDYTEEVNGVIAEDRNTRERFVAYCNVAYGEATSLSKLNANDYKKQVFTVLEDTDFGCRTQYVSYDINGDGRYEFVYIGADKNGRDGLSIYSANEYNYETIKSRLKTGDLLITAGIIESIVNTRTKVRGSFVGDLFEFISGDEYYYIGSILGPVGEKGEKGEQGIQGVQGVQGIQGEKGEKGDKGETGLSLSIKTGILNNPSELPPFDSVSVGDAYRVINISGSVVTYDIYFKAVDGTDWDIQPNWGGVKGDKGDTGEQGLQGVQGIQGIQGEKGEPGSPRYAHKISFIFREETVRMTFWCNSSSKFNSYASFLNEYYKYGVVLSITPIKVNALAFAICFYNSSFICINCANSGSVSTTNIASNQVTSFNDIVVTE